MTVAEAAELLEVSTQTVRNKVAKKELPAIETTNRSGQPRYYIPRSTVEELLHGDNGHYPPPAYEDPRVGALTARVDLLERMVFELLADKEGPEDEATGFDGTKLKHLREREYLTQGELAQKAGVALHTVNRLERGQSTRPQRSTLLALAQALEVPHTALLV